MTILSFQLRARLSFRPDIQNIYDEHELERTGTVKESLTVQQQGGLGKVHQLFGDKLNVIEELNETLVA